MRPIVAPPRPPGNPGGRESAHIHRRPGEPPGATPPGRVAGSGRSDPRDPIELFRRLIEARRAHDVKQSLALRRELLAVGWSISPTEPKGGAAR